MSISIILQVKKEKSTIDFFLAVKKSLLDQVTVNHC